MNMMLDNRARTIHPTFNVMERHAERIATTLAKDIDRAGVKLNIS